MDGIFNIAKATGMTSHDVVARIRKLLHQKRVGHAGTLDPAASGVLPICVGQGTRVAEYLSESGKAYRAEITFGIVTDTYDAEGSVIRTSDCSDLSLEQIQQTLPGFLGPQMQLPPLYSAIKIQGQPAYKRARAGQEITLEPRPITISRLEVLAWQAPVLTLAIECSKGTYIRSLAYDLGERLSYGAHLTALVRTRSGPFTLERSVSLAQLAEAVAEGTATQYLFPVDYPLQAFVPIILDPTTAEQVRHGNAFRHEVKENQPSAEFARIYTTEGHFLAIAVWQPEGAYWQPKKVFNEQ